MRGYCWNKNIKYRKLQSRHILVDISTSNRIIEISLVLAKLFSQAGINDFNVAFENWHAEIINEFENIDSETILETVSSLKKKGLIFHVE